jgi:hypothetical protein
MPWVMNQEFASQSGKRRKEMKNYFASLFLLLVITLPVGGHVVLTKEGWKSPARNLRYCGMVSKGVFSVSDSMYRNSVNLYFDSSVDVFQVGSTLYRVIEVTPSKLVVRPLNLNTEKKLK